MENYIIVKCPWCHEDVLVMKNEINCAIFRHGVLKSNHQQMDPHASKEECDRLADGGLIYGCGKPFRIEGEHAVVCGYI